MRKTLLAGFVFLSSLMAKAQFTQSDLIYYVGEGPDTAVVVFDFLDETEDSSYAWGYLFDATTDATGADALNAIAADEQFLDVVFTGDFLTEIHYNAHSGVGGEPDYWGTWSKTAETEWEMNDGVTTVLENGDWFGCSYTDFDPAVTPGEPVPAYESAKYDMDDIVFWAGEGEDSAVLVLDFVNSPSGEAMTYAWGFAFDGTTDGAEMLAAIDEADVNLEVDADEYLSNIFFNGLEGVAADPGYWGTWSGTNLTDWTMNLGIGTEVNDGDWFGCSYDEWPPRRPFYPISAIDSADVTIDDVEFIYGSGENKAVLVLDFNEWLPGQSYTFGYLFEEETITAEEVMQGLEDADVFGLAFNIDGGFLLDIVYDAAGEEGLNGMPNYWSTWSARNVGGWEMNTGISTEMSDGDWFACSYTNWGPATPPGLPEAGHPFWSIDEEEQNRLTIYPNPAENEVSISFEGQETHAVQIIDIQGRTMFNDLVVANDMIDVSTLESGVYFIVTALNGQTVKEKLVIK